MPSPLPSDPNPPSQSDVVRVMVVDDSAVVRGLISRWLNEVDGIDVVSTQHTGKAALDAIETVDPDIVVLDIEMPEMDGLTALPLILKKKPSIAVIVASTLTRRNADISLQAMSLGARDYVAKPEGARGLISQQEFRRDLAQKVLALGSRNRRRSVSTQPARRVHVARTAAEEAPDKDAIRLRPFSTTRPRILVIGSSTGGPPALSCVVKNLGAAGTTVPILIAQHMPPTFTAIMAEHLGRAAGLPAGEARDGEKLVAGRIYVAPGGFHMRVEQDGAAPVVRIDDGPPINYCRPAVDPLFESAASVFSSATLALVLTGMGHDGSAGAVKIADAGGTVIAQDETTSVVWGMPGAAARAGACAAVLPLNDIAGKLSGIITGARP
jgi:two-component system, chemotaxis family, protein-glutamate methylesterase/glutaminase